MGCRYIDCSSGCPETIDIFFAFKVWLKAAGCALLWKDGLEREKMVRIYIAAGLCLKEEPTLLSAASLQHGVKQQEQSYSKVRWRTHFNMEYLCISHQTEQRSSICSKTLGLKFKFPFKTGGTLNGYCTLTDRRENKSVAID